VSDRISLVLGDTEFRGWKGVDVRVGIEQMAGCFDLTCADRWALQGQPLPALPGAACSVRIAGQTIISGYIDEISPSYSAADHSLAIRGRDLTADMVDSAAITDGGGWQQRSLRQIAAALAAPHGIRVSVDAASAADADLVFPQVQLQPCETAFDALSRLARLRGVLLVSDGVGGLTQPQIKPGETKQATFEVLALSDATSKIYKMPISLQYYDNLGKMYNTSSVFALPVATAPDIYFITESTTLSGEKTQGDVVIRVVNPSCRGFRMM